MLARYGIIEEYTNPASSIVPLAENIFIISEKVSAVTFRGLC